MWRERLMRASGLAGMPRRALRLVTAMSALALICAVGMPWLSGTAISKTFPIVVGLVFLAHIFGLRMRVGTTTINVAWGEAALIVGFTVMDPSWIPAAVGVAILAGTGVRGLFEPRSPMECLRASASLTVSAAVAAAVVQISGINTGQLEPASAMVLALAAVIYTLGTLAFLALHLRARDGQRFTEVVASALQGSPIMIMGNLALGLLAAMLWQTDGERVFLLVLPPLLLLMYQHYSHRLREEEERRTWRAFALASRSLHRLDEVAVAQEGVRAARVLFAVRRVELSVIGSRTRYALESGSSNVEVKVDKLPPRPDDLPGYGNGPLEVTRSLEVAGGPVGNLTMELMRLGGWSTNDQHRLAAFGDALAAALHDAATHGALRDLHERTTYESLHDALTRLLNRDALLDQGHGMLRACPPDQPVALVLLDLDNFKAVNDTLGHLAGDELLQRTAARLADDADEGELVARLGGDEFALLMTHLPTTTWQPTPSTNPLEAATAAALRRARVLTASLAMPIEVAGVTLSAEVSAGVVVATAGPIDLIELLRRADIALYEAKESGVRTMVYQPRRDDTSTDRLALVAELQSALTEDDQIDVVLLPTVDLPSGAPIGVEALVRWRHPRRGQLIPKDFVRAVEASELLGQFTRYVLDRSLACASVMAQAGLDLPISVNLSPRSLLDPQLPTDLAGLLRKHRVPAEHLVLEITETVVLSPLRVTDQVLHELRDLGVGFAVDDFGTGYSSFTFLTRITVDELKIDRTFVARMAESKEAAAIVRAVIDLGRRLGIRVVAEGVETPKQRAALVRLGCDAGQGFHFGKPVRAEELVDTLARLRSSARPIRAVRSGQAGLARGS